MSHSTPGDRLHKADIQWGLARVLQNLPGNRDEIMEFARFAKENYRAHSQEGNVRVIEKWIESVERASMEKANEVEKQ